jgi:recombining binding protein (suppressor of hairless)
MCLHAAVAQKSYGSEKRFLCPPPIVHIQGPVWQMRSQQLSMAVVSEQGERSFDQKTSLDNNMTGSFKFLHVTGTAKAKSFTLSLDIMDPPSATGEGGGDNTSGRVWASFDSAPVTIISKPSKKTAKTRNISSCILAGGPVSLFNRINSQTVRTKYMTIDSAQLCASNVSWSAFNVNVVRRPEDVPPVHGGHQAVTYGCEVVLSDTLSNIATSPLVIRKVDKGRVSADDGGPVSQMQKIALQRVNADGSRHYSSAAGPLPGPPGVTPTPGVSSQSGTHPLIFATPRVREDMKDGVRVLSDEVDDYLCWTIVGISKFQYTFFDAFGQNNSIPELPITPFPTLFTAPSYRPANNTVELTVSNFFYEDPKTRTQQPLTVYLGSVGPLRARCFPPHAPGPLTNISYGGGMPGPSSELAGNEGAVPGVSSNVPAGRYTPLHTLVTVEMPPLSEIIKALQEDVIPPNVLTTSTTTGPHAAASGGEGGSQVDGGPQTANNSPQPSIAGRTLPILFIRASDGVGYHSGRTVACENVFQSIDLSGMAPGHVLTPPGGPTADPGWLAAAQAAASADGGLHGWTLRVL